MALVNMDYSGRPVAEKIVKSRLFINKLTGNANFSIPNPTLAELTTDTDALEVANEAAQGGSKASKQALKDAEAKLDSQISILGAYIQSEAEGNEAKILSTGALVRKGNAPVGELPAPIGLLAKIGAMEGTVDCKWDTVKGSKSYIIQMASDLAGTTWSYSGASTATKYTAVGLSSGKKYLFRVAALGAAGQGPWSDPAMGMAG